MRTVGNIDPSFEIDPSVGGSYRRRIEDIARGLVAIGADSLSPPAQFAAYFFGCEKLAPAIIGIEAGRPAPEQYSRKHRIIHLSKVIAAHDRLGFNMSHADLTALFSGDHDIELSGAPRASSARLLRNTMLHDFGPSNVRSVGSNATKFLPVMQRFLALEKPVVAYLEARYAALSKSPTRAL